MTVAAPSQSGPGGLWLALFVVLLPGVALADLALVPGPAGKPAAQVAPDASADARRGEAVLLAPGPSDASPRPPSLGPGEGQDRAAWTPEHGLILPSTGDYLAPVRSGWIDPSGGLFIPAQDGRGVIDTRTGRYLPLAR